MDIHIDTNYDNHEKVDIYMGDEHVGWIQANTIVITNGDSFVNVTGLINAKENMVYESGKYNK